MDPLNLCIALGPLAVYLLLLGLIGLSSRPFLTSGFRDGATLAIAVAGFAMVGPLRLFVPETAVYRFGLLVWLILLVVYGLGAILTLLLLRPRLVIYNVTLDQFRPILASVVQEVDDQSRWAGDSLLLPKLGVHLHLESFPPLRNVQLLSTGAEQDFAGWRRLESEIGRRLSTVSVNRSPRGVGLIAVSLLITVAITFSMLIDQPALAREISELLRYR
jgi:hypothetical protein